MTKHTFTMSEAQAERIHKMAEQDISTIKNHIAMYVETDRPEKAKELVVELRHLEAIFAGFNMVAKRERVTTDSPMVTDHRVFDTK